MNSTNTGSSQQTKNMLNSLYREYSLNQTEVEEPMGQSLFFSKIDDYLDLQMRKKTTELTQTFNFEYPEDSLLAIEELPDLNEKF